MGGERFDTPQPESYLFGENSDLNFLGSRPTPVSCVNCLCYVKLVMFLISFHIRRHNRMNLQKLLKVW